MIEEPGKIYEHSQQSDFSVKDVALYFVRGEWKKKTNIFFC